MNPPARLSARCANLHASPIREILSVIDRPGMISFAGGLPAPETFPRPDLSGMPATQLQYGASEGEPALRERIAAEVSALGLPCTAAQVIVLSGSQQGIDLVAKLFVDPGTPVWTETPTYLAALQVLRFFGARLVGGGALPEAGDAPVLSYAIPTFQNPTGHCYSLAERTALAQRCDELGTVLFEDDPYRDLAFDPCERRPVCSLLRRSDWVYQGSFSKTFAPGLRLGFLVASPALVTPLSRLKQAADLHSNRVSQWLVLRHLEDPRRAESLAALVDTYRGKRDRFQSLLQEHLSGHARWEVPRGGLFFWLELAGAVDTRALLGRAIEQGLAFMPGEAFYPEPRAAGAALRLNFSHASAEQAERGLALLAALLR